jgi:hypothetical protein
MEGHWSVGLDWLSLHKHKPGWQYQSGYLKVTTVSHTTYLRVKRAEIMDRYETTFYSLAMEGRVCLMCVKTNRLAATWIEKVHLFSARSAGSGSSMLYCVVEQRLLLAMGSIDY